jgi:hypothetical protein
MTNNRPEPSGAFVNPTGLLKPFAQSSHLYSCGSGNSVRRATSVEGWVIFIVGVLTVGVTGVWTFVGDGGSISTWVKIGSGPCEGEICCSDDVGGISDAVGSGDEKPQADNNKNDKPISKWRRNT